MSVFVLAPLVSRVASGTVSLSSVYDATEFPVTNAQSQVLTSVTRTAGPDLPRAVLTVDLGDSYPLIAVGAGGLNLDGLGQYRCRISPAALSGYVEDSPDALIASTNIGSGGLTDIDEDPTSPDSTGIEGSAGGQSDITLGFTPSTMQDTAIQMHCFRIAISASSASAARLVSVELRENGSFVRELVDATEFPDGFIVPVSSTYLFVGRFAGDEISNHSNLECKITWEPTEISLGDPPVIEAVDLAYLALDANASEFDWQDALPNAVAGQLDGTDPAEVIFQRPAVVRVVVDGNGDPVHDDAQYVQMFFWNPYNADGYIEIGIAEAGPGIVVNTADAPLESPEFFFEDDGTVVHNATSGRELFTGGDPPKRGIRISVKALEKSLAENAMASFVGMQQRKYGHFVIPHGAVASVLALPFWGGRNSSRVSLRGVDFLPGRYTSSLEFTERR